MVGITLKNIIEAALLTADGPLGIEPLQRLFAEDERPTKSEIQQVLSELLEDCALRGVELVQRGDDFHYQTREQLAPWLRRMHEGRAPRYSRALLETLAIIAYHQPVTRGDIEQIRGVSVSSDMIRTLLQREWIQQIGTRDVPGKPGLFGTTQGFLAYFGLASLQALPALREPRDPDEIASELNLRSRDLSIDIGDEITVSSDSAGETDETAPPQIGENQAECTGPSAQAPTPAGEDPPIVGPPESLSIGT